MYRDPEKILFTSKFFRVIYRNDWLLPNFRTIFRITFINEFACIDMEDAWVYGISVGLFGHNISVQYITHKERQKTSTQSKEKQPKEKQHTIIENPPKYELGDVVISKEAYDSSSAYTVGFRAYSFDLDDWYYEDDEGLSYSFAEDELELLTEFEEHKNAEMLEHTKNTMEINSALDTVFNDSVDPEIEANINEFASKGKKKRTMW